MASARFAPFRGLVFAAVAAGCSSAGAVNGAPPRGPDSGVEAPTLDAASAKDAATPADSGAGPAAPISDASLDADAPSGPTFAVDDYHASGSTQTLSCSGTKGSSVITCSTGAGDFKVGEGVMVTGGGDAPDVAALPAAPSPNSHAAGQGTHTYCYKFVVSDAMRGIGPPSSAGCLSKLPLLTGAANAVWFTNQPNITAASQELMIYASLDSGSYDLIGVSSVVTDNGQRWGDLGGWPATLSVPDSKNAVKNEDLFTTVQAIAGDEITLADALLNTTEGDALVAHDDTAAAQAAIHAAVLMGKGVVQFGAKAYNVQRPSFMVYPANVATFTLSMRDAPTWQAPSTFLVDGDDIAINGAGKMSTRLIFGPQQYYGVAFNLGHVGLDPFYLNFPVHRIAAVEKGATEIVLANANEAPDFQSGDDVFIYGGNIGYNPTKPNVDGSGSLDHFSEKNTVVSVGPNGQLTLKYPTSKRYYTDSLGDPFGVINIRGLSVHRFTMSNLAATMQSNFFRGGQVYDTLVDSVYVDGHSINTFGGGGKQGVTIQNSTWTFGSGIGGWIGIDEFDQFVDVKFLNNTIHGVSALGSEGPSQSAQIYATEGSTQFTYVNNDFYDMEITFQDTTDDVVENNRFHNSFLAVGTAYQSGADHSYLNFGSQAAASVNGNTFAIDANFSPPWVLRMGHFDDAVISGNMIEFQSGSGGGIPMIQAASGAVTGNTIETGTSAGTSGIMVSPDPAPGASSPPIVVENNTIDSTGPSSWDVRVNDPGSPYGGHVCVRDNSLTAWMSQTMTVDNANDVALSCVGN